LETQSLKKERNMTKWLDVKEHPPQYARVLCLTTAGRVELCEVIGDYKDGETTYYEQSNGAQITHWMPVPEGNLKND
jgi:hypothetical protein